MADSAPKKRILAKKTPLFVEVMKRLIKEKPLGLFGGVITLVFLFTGIFANVIAPYGMNQGLGEYIQPPSARFILGTDNIGRDLFSRIIYGARISVVIGLASTTLGTIGSLLIGLSVYIGPKFDLIMQRIVDAWMCFPALVLAMVIMSMVGVGTTQVILVISFTLAWSGSRIVRGAIMQVMANPYVDSAKSMGCSHARIIMRHIMPNIVGPILMLFSVRVPEAILLEASLSFLGFGVAPPTPSWGIMLSGPGRHWMFLAPWMAVWPGLALAVVVYGVNMFGDAMRDLLDPRLRGGTGRFGAKIKAKRAKKLEAVNANG